MSHIAFAQGKDYARVRPGIGQGSILRACVQPALQCGAFFLLSLAVCFRIPSPYALSAFAVLALKRDKPWWPFLGIGLGVLFRAIWGAELDVWQLARAALILLLRRERKVTVLNACLLTSLALLPRLVYRLITMTAADAPVLAAFSILLGAVSIPAFSQLANKKNAEETQDGLLCRLFPLLILMLGAARISVLTVNLGWAAASFFTLTVSAMLGSGAGICAGLLCGLPLALSGYNAALMLCFSLSGMVSGLFRQKNVPSAR